MTIGLAPVIGIPLPFISYGGTSLMTFTIMLFILIRFGCRQANGIEMKLPKIPPPKGGTSPRTAHIVLYS